MEFTKENLLMESEKVLEALSGTMVKFLKVNGKTEPKMVTESGSLPKEITTKVTGNSIGNMVKAFTSIK